MVEQLAVLKKERELHHFVDNMRDLVDRAKKDAPAMILAREKKTMGARRAKVASAAKDVDDMFQQREANRYTVQARRYHLQEIQDMCARNRFEKKAVSRVMYRGFEDPLEKHRRANEIGEAMQRLRAERDRMQAEQEVARLAEEARIEKELRLQDDALRQEEERQAALRREEKERQATMRREEEAKLAHLRTQQQMWWQAHMENARRAEAFHLEQKRRAQEAAEHARRQQEQAHRAMQAQQTQQELEKKMAEEREFYRLYNVKWKHLKSDVHIPVVLFNQVPWPVLAKIRSPDEITQIAVTQFILNPRRNGLAGKTPRDVIKAEMLKWHPDKFNSKVMPRILSTDVVVTQQAADKVVRILTAILQQLPK